MPVYKNDADDDWGWDTIPFIMDGTMLLSGYGTSDQTPIFYFDEEE